MSGLEAPHYPELPPSFVPNPISEIEDFFGEALSAKLIEHTIARLPYEQLKIVGNRCTKASGMAELFIGTRGIDSSESIHGYEAFAPLRDQEIHLHDGLLQAGLATNIAEVPGLKQVLLYCDRVIVRNTLLAPLRLPEPEAARTFAARLRELLPLAGLIRAGNVIPVTNEGILTSRYDAYQITMTRSDPFINKLLDPHPDIRERVRYYYNEDDSYVLQPGPADPPLRHGERIVMSEAEAGPLRMNKVASLLAPLYPIPISPADLGRVMEYSGRVRAGQLVPLIHDPLLAYHIAQGMRAVTEPGKIPVPPPSPFTLPVNFQVPALGGLSLEDIVSVRASEAVFSDMQTALANLAIAGGQDVTRFDTYEAYESEMRRLARDIVAPVQDRLLSWQRSIERKRWAGKSAGLLAQLGLGLMPIPLLGEGVGMGIDHAIEKGSARRRRDLQTATRIMKTLL